MIETETDKNIPVKIGENFIRDILEDLELMDESRLAGLGVTGEELKRWQERQKQ